MDRQIVTSFDGSSTIYVPQLNEHFHSIHGAKQESNHVYIQNGLNFFIENSNKKSINIFEMGFGTGLNILLTIEHLIDKNIIANIETIEAYPLMEEEIELLIDYKKQPFFEILHTASWNKTHQLAENIYFKKCNVFFDMYNPDIKFDVVFFDAFAPISQPELWTEEVFSKLFNWMNSNGVFVTYCAKGYVKRNLKAAGFIIESLPGPPMKREMIRAIKP